MAEFYSLVLEPMTAGHETVIVLYANHLAAPRKLQTKPHSDLSILLEKLRRVGVEETEIVNAKSALMGENIAKTPRSYAIDKVLLTPEDLSQLGLEPQI